MDPRTSVATAGDPSQDTMLRERNEFLARMAQSGVTVTAGPAPTAPVSRPMPASANVATPLFFGNYSGVEQPQHVSVLQQDARRQQQYRPAAPIASSMPPVDVPLPPHENYASIHHAEATSMKGMLNTAYYVPSPFLMQYCASGMPIDPASVHLERALPPMSGIAIPGSGTGPIIEKQSPKRGSERVARWKEIQQERLVQLQYGYDNGPDPLMARNGIPSHAESMTTNHYSGSRSTLPNSMLKTPTNAIPPPRPPPPPRTRYTAASASTASAMLTTEACDMLNRHFGSTTLDSINASEAPLRSSKSKVDVPSSDRRHMLLAELGSNGGLAPSDMPSATANGSNGSLHRLERNLLDMVNTGSTMAEPVADDGTQVQTQAYAANQHDQHQMSQFQQQQQSNAPVIWFANTSMPMPPERPYRDNRRDGGYQQQQNNYRGGHENQSTAVWLQGPQSDSYEWDGAPRGNVQFHQRSSQQPYFRGGTANEGFGNHHGDNNGQSFDNTNNGNYFQRSTGGNFGVDHAGRSATNWKAAPPRPSQNNNYTSYNEYRNYY